MPLVRRAGGHVMGLDHFSGWVLALRRVRLTRPVAALRRGPVIGFRPTAVACKKCRGRLPFHLVPFHARSGRARAGLAAVRLPAHGTSGLRRLGRTGSARGDCVSPSRHPPARFDSSDPCTHVPRPHRSGSPLGRSCCGHCADSRGQGHCGPRTWPGLRKRVGQTLGCAGVRRLSYDPSRPTSTGRHHQPRGCRPVSVAPDRASGLQSPSGSRCWPGR